MAEQELQELSERVAEKFGIDAWNPNRLNPYPWLHTDLATVMRLAIERGVVLSIGNHSAVVLGFNSTAKNIYIQEYYINHPSREQAVIVAVMKALMEIEK